MKEKLLLGMGTVLLLFGFAQTANANENESEAEQPRFVVLEDRALTDEELAENQNNLLMEGLYTPNLITRGAGVPSAKKVINRNSYYDYNGYTNGNVSLFSNYKFYGSTTYRVTINNTGPRTLTARAKRQWKEYASTTVGKGRSTTLEFQGIYSDTEWWLEFKGDGNIKVNGRVSK